MRLWTENKRFAVVVAGRRSGKTELAKRRLVVRLPQAKAWPDARYFAAAPTRDQAKRIFWGDIKEMTPEAWIKKVYESDLCIKTKFGSELWVVGLDKPQRIEGTPWDGGVLDEYGDMRGPVWAENVRPALSDRAGWCWFLGVPDGFNHLKDLVDYASNGKDPEWGAYRWLSSDILKREEIEAARRQLDPRTFRQEYEASFEGAYGRAYYAYSALRHQDPLIAVKDSMPITVCCDFNVGLCVWELVQTEGGRINVFDEIALRNTNTLEMGRELLRRYGGHRKGIVVYGDAAGGARSTAGKSDYAILAQLGFNDQRIKKANPAVKDRVNAMNSMLENANGEARLFHHPGCRMLKKDLERVEWRSEGAGLDKSHIELTHAADALGYFIEYEFPLNLRAADPSRRFYK